MNNFEKFTKKNKLSHAEYSERYAHKRKPKQKRGKTRYMEDSE